VNLHFLVPGNPAARTGGYVYDRRIVAGLPACGVAVSLHGLPDGFPDADAAMLRGADALLGALPDAAVVVIDGLAFGAMPQVVRQHAQRLKLVALVHHPLSFESGLDPARARQLADSEREALAYARLVVVTSAATAAALTAPGGFGVSPERIAVVEPGTDRVPPADPAHAAAVRARSASDQGPALLCVATLTPRKGHEVLLEALSRLRTRRWTLRCAGSTTRDPQYARTVAARIDSSGLAQRVILLGELDDDALALEYSRADVFVLATQYEGYGMAFAEALAHGLPIVGTTAGAVAGTVPPGAGLLVPPDDVDALEAALARVLDEPDLRQCLAQRARAAGERLDDWPTSCRRFASIVTEVAVR
jgi:glycosyltransferase involved in cell wall biosynthesis